VGGRYVASVRKASDGSRSGAATYLDTASAEPLHPVARDTLMAALERGYADPRRLHGPGRDARLLLDNARAVVAESLGVRADEVTFTSSGTDAVHRGLLGLRRRSDDRVAHSAVEHSAVVHAAAWTGVEPLEIPVDRLGRVSPDDAARAAAVPGVGVVALQSANHEVGTTQPVAAVAEAIDLPLFVDACASMGRVPLPDGWAALAGSPHKWGGPAGVGVLLVRKGVRWVTPFPADDRIDERSAGFENVPAVLAAAGALQAVVAERDAVDARQRALVDRIRAAVALVPDIEVVGDPLDRLPHLVTFSCLYVDGEALVTELDRRGYGVASGSACTASTLTPSRVLEAMGVLTHGNVRLSVSRDTTEEQVDGFLAAFSSVVRDIRAEAGL
jgi:cysteine desulfurase